MVDLLGGGRVKGHPQPGLLQQLMVKRYSGLTLIAICLGSFLLGRLTMHSHDVVTIRERERELTSVRRAGAKLEAKAKEPCPPCVQDCSQCEFPELEAVASPDPEPARERGALEITRFTDDRDRTRPGPMDFDALMEAIGLPELKPPMDVGPSGTPVYTTIPFQQISWYPRAYVFPNFIDKERAEHFVKLASSRIRPSSLALKRGDTAEGTKDVRTSQGTFLSRHEDPDGVLAWVEERIALITGIPAGHGEPYNVLRYEQNQHYAAHFDTFNPEEYGPQNSQRVATVLLYLSDVEEGGETIFPLEGKGGTQRLQNIDYNACNMGLKYKPRMGDALLFWSTDLKGNFDKHALHGGCPVTKGTKWVATKWIRDKCTSGSSRISKSKFGTVDCLGGD